MIDKIDAEKTAVIIVDMLNDFVREDGALPVPGAENLIPNQQRILEKARDEGLFVVYVADHHMPDDEEFEVWGAHAVEGTEGAQVIEEIAPEGNEKVIPKRRYSGFFGTDLDLTLREHDIEKVIIFGVLTDICVNYTSAGATARGYDAVVVSDAVASNDEKDHKFALKHMQKVHDTTVGTTNEVLAAMA